MPSEIGHVVEAALVRHHDPAILLHHLVQFRHAVDPRRLAGLLIVVLRLGGNSIG